MANEFVIKNGFTSKGNSIVEGVFSAYTISSTTYQNLPTDVRVTGGTYSNGTSTFTNNTGGTFNVNGFYTGATDVFVTGGTYSNGTSTFTNNTGGTFNVNGFYTGATDVFVTGGTYSNGTATFTNNTGDTFTVTGFTSTGVTLGSFGITIDGGGSTLTPGLKNYLSLPYNGYITGYVIIGDQSGSTSIDIWKDNYGSFPPTSGDSITGGNYPSLSSQQINQDTTLSGWTTNFSVGDIIAFNVLSASTITKINLTINVIKT